MTDYFEDGEKRYKVQIRYNFLKKKIEIHITYLKFIKFFDRGLLEDKIEVTFCNAFSLKMQGAISLYLRLSISILNTMH